MKISWTYGTLGFAIIALIAIWFMGLHKIWAEDDYMAKLISCLEARSNGTYEQVEYICPGESDITEQDILLQIIYDEESKKIDAEIEKLLVEFQQVREKEKDFAKSEAWIREKLEQTTPGDTFWQKYTNLCNPQYENSVIQIARRGLEKEGKNLTTVGVIGQFLQTEGCMDQARKKLGAYQDAAWIYAKISLAESYKIDEKEFFEKLDENYQRLLDKFMIYLGRLNEINKKQDSVTKNPI